MSKLTYLSLALVFSVFLLGVSMNSYADYSVPVSHTHNGREHSHQLPKEGLNHRHGIGQPGVAIRQQNRVIYSSSTTIPNSSTNNQAKTTYKPPKPNPQSNSNYVNNDPSLHTHAGREHRHPLPNQGVYHRHGSGATGQRVVANRSDPRNNGSLDNGDNYDNNNDSNYDDNLDSDRRIRRQNRRDSRRWDRARGLSKYVKGATRCTPGSTDCNVCAVNVQQQFQKAASNQINWSRKSWNFTWPQPYPPQNVRPLDVFDGNAEYALGIPDDHVQGFVRTNNHLFPYAGSHSHKRKGGIFVVKQGANGEQFLSSLHKTKSRHPSGVQIIGKYLIYGDGKRLIFKDMNSQNQDLDIRLTAQNAQFGGGLGIVKLAKDNHLLIATGPGGQKRGVRYNRFYHLKSINGRPVSLSFINQSTTKKPQQWPNILSFSENMSLITECGTGDIYSVHSTGSGGIATISGSGYWRLSKLVSNGKALGLTAINALTTKQDLKRCNARASATVNVSPQKRLEFVCHGYAKDPDGSGFNILGKSSRNRDRFYYNVGVVR